MVQAITLRCRLPRCGWRSVTIRPWPALINRLCWGDSMFRRGWRWAAFASRSVRTAPCMCRIKPVRRSPTFQRPQVLAGKAPLEQLENRIVLLGSTAPGLTDLRVTPFSNAFPGVEIHAHLIAGMLDGTTRVTPPWADDARLVAVLLLGALLTVVLLRFGPTVGLACQHGAAGVAAGSLRRGVVALLGGADGGADADAVRPVCAQHRLRLLCRNAQQAPDHQAVRPVRAARTGRRNEPGSGALHDGRAVARHDACCSPTSAASPIFPRSCRRPNSPKC